MVRKKDGFMANNKKWLKLLIALVILAAVVAVIIFALPPALRVIGYLAWLLMPFIVGYVFSLMVNPLVNKMQQKLRLPRGVSAVIVIVLVLGIIGGICGFVVWKGIDEARSVYSNLPQIIENAQGGTQSLGEHLSGFIKNLPPNMQQSIMSVMENLSSRAGEIANTYLMPLVSRAGDMAKAVPSALVAIIVFILSSYFMITDDKTVSNAVKRVISPALTERLRVVKKELGKYLGGYFKAQVILLFIAFAIILAGFLILGIKYALLIAFLIAFIDALPFFGSGLILWPWAAIAFIYGDVRVGVGMLIIYLAVQLMRRFAEPKLVASGVGMKPIPTLISMYVGYKVWSLGGLIAGPIALIILVSFYKAGVFDSVIRFIKDFWRLFKKQCGNYKRFLFKTMESDWNDE